MSNSVTDVSRELERLRHALDRAFSPETALEGTQRRVASSGHCAAVAAIVLDRFGGYLVSTRLQGESHWFNRIRMGDSNVDVDLTGDQFGQPAIQTAPAGRLYPECRLRDPSELNQETRRRARLLAALATACAAVESKCGVPMGRP